MATYYWVGGSGNWDATTTTNWASSSGGSGGAGVPTLNDDVIFDAGSNTGTDPFTVTITGTSSAPAVCNDFSTGGAGGALDGVMTLAITNLQNYLDVYGSFTLPATNFTFTGTAGFLRFRATTTGKTITTNGVSVGTGNIIDFNGVGGEWTLGSAFTGVTTNQLLITNGSLITNNFNLTTNYFISNNSNTRSISLGSSAVTLSRNAECWNTATTTNLTFNAGTSAIVCSGANPTFTGGGLTFYNVSFTSAAAGTTTINGANTFNNLNQTSRSATGKRTISFNDNQTINGTLTLGAANTAIRRLVAQSGTTGTQRTITLNGTLATLADVDFRDIATAGTVGTWTGTRLGDCLNNSGITLDAPKTVYRVGTGNWSATQWSLSSGGSADVNNFPLAQDTMVFDTGTVTGTHTIDLGWNLGNLDCSLLNVAVTIASASVFAFFYGDITLDADVTLTATSINPLTFSGQNTTQTITSAGATFPQPITIDSPSGTVQLLDNLTCNGTVTLTAGTLDLSSGNRTLTCNVFSSTNSNIRSISFGAGNITLTGNNASIWAVGNATNLNYTGTPTINCTYAGATGTRTVSNGSASGGSAALALNVNVTAGTDAFTVNTNSHINNIDMTGWVGQFGNGFFCYGNFTMSAGSNIYGGIAVMNFVAPTSQTITMNGVVWDRPVTFNSAAGTFNMVGAFSTTATRAVTLANGALKLAAGTTNTFGAFATSGTAQKYLQSTVAGSQATISQASGTVNASYLTIQDNNATGGATFNAFVDQSNIDAGNNDGWDFGISPVVGSYEYTYQLRSFTQPRRF